MTSQLLPRTNYCFSKYEIDVPAHVTDIHTVRPVVYYILPMFLRIYAEVLVLLKDLVASRGREYINRACYTKSGQRKFHKSPFKFHIYFLW